MSPALLLLATALALLTAGTAGAQSGHGPGFGLAFPADQNGYPGPLHVLELKGPLRLTPEQETRVRAQFEAMLAEARRRAARLAAAEGAASAHPRADA